MSMMGRTQHATSGARNVCKAVTCGLVTASLLIASIPCRACADEIAVQATREDGLEVQADDLTVAQGSLEVQADDQANALASSDNGIELINERDGGGYASTDSAHVPDAERAPHDQNSCAEDSARAAAEAVMAIAAANAREVKTSSPSEPNYASTIKDVATGMKTTMDISKIVTAFMTGNVGLFFSGSEGIMNDILGICGITVAAGPTNQNLLDGINDIKEGISELRNQMHDLDAKVSGVASKQDIQYASKLIDALDDLAFYCESGQEYFEAESLARLGIGPLSKDATQKEQDEWNDMVVKAILKEEREGTVKFKGFTNTMNQIHNLFVKVTNMTCASNETNPIVAWDKYWESELNWETQAYTPKEGLRRNAEFQMLRAYALLATYYDIAHNPETVQASLTKSLKKALKKIQGMDPGMSPDDVRMNDRTNPTIMCYSVGRKLKAGTSIAAKLGWGNWDDFGAALTEEQLQEYLRRLHGGRLDDDLKSAGLWTTTFWNNGSPVAIDLIGFPVQAPKGRTVLVFNLEGSPMGLGVRPETTRTYPNTTTYMLRDAPRCRNLFFE